jgi:hypothetical protein
MRIAIVSDTHDNVPAVQEILTLIKGQEVETILHCGDIESSQVVELFAGTNTHFVLGNCDRDCAQLRQSIKNIDATLHERYGHLEIAGKQIAFTHGHERALLHDLETSGAFDYLFHGHTHIVEDRMAGRTRVINPGAMVRVSVRTFVILDVTNGERVELRVG